MKYIPIKIISPVTSFSCDACGLCCTMLHINPILASLDRGDGTCTFFNAEERSCSIYDKRPTVCKVGEAYSAYKDVMTIEQYYEINTRLCNMFKDNANMLPKPNQSKSNL